MNYLKCSFSDFLSFSLWNSMMKKMSKAGYMKMKAPARFELAISCLLDRRFNQLSHGAICPRQIQFDHIFLVEKLPGKKVWSPNVVLEPTTLRLRVSCSTDWASRAVWQYGWSRKLSKSHPSIVSKARQIWADWQQGSRGRVVKASD